MADTGRHELTAPPRRHRLASALLAVTVTGVIAATVAVAVLRPPSVVGSAQASNLVAAGERTPVVTRIPATGASRHAHAQEKLIAAIVDDLTAFWGAAGVTPAPFPALRGGLTAMDSASAVGSAPCVGSPSHIIGNAFYCPLNDGIIYDASALVPVLLHRYSIGGIVATIAHEFGHAVQARARSDTSEPGEPAPDSLLTEAQADCAAGAFLGWVVDGGAEHVTLGPDMMMAAIGPLVDFADPVTVRPDDPTAHGLAVDRLGWFLRGINSGPDGCLAMTEDTLAAVLGRVADDGDGERFTDRQTLLAAAEQSIHRFAPDSPAASTEPLITAPVAAVGQFAQATALALAVGTEMYRTSEGAACFAGAWVGAIYGGDEPLGSRAGDADEALQAVRLRPGATFEDLAAYTDGFSAGVATCDTAQ